ncbi:SET domain-containing protein SmydA-8-like [Culicoides brevitarsis]|uniref:SET domain-containing protein SmydA-8-like n=1 Tax=Culicoides brevitarsis TaxID=469753 RepID=UPI00307B6A86
MQHFTVEKNSELGRFAIASRDLKAGETFLEEIPFAFGPKPDSAIVCLECSMPTDERCAKCGWPLCEYCSPNEKLAHTEFECDLIVKNNAKFFGTIDQHGACLQLDCILPLRVLMAKDRDEARWKAEVAEMEDHEKERKAKPTWNADLQNIVKYIRGPLKCEQYSEELIQKVLGILEVNAFEAVSSTGYAIRVLYPKLAILSHNCVPNTTHTIFMNEGYRMTARTTVDVAKGEELFSNYTYLSQCTLARQYHLREGKFFICKCKRCLDPSELCTHLSTLKCTKCPEGGVLPSDPIDVEGKSDWKCTHCDFKAAGTTIQRALATIQAEIDQVLAMEYTAERLQALEAILKKYRAILHPRHYQMISLKQALIELYGRIPGYTMPELPDVLLERKLDLCREVLKVLDIIEPGKTRSRGMILYEMHAVMVLLAQSAFRQKVIYGLVLKKRLNEAADVLAEAVDILSLEDPASTEGQIALQAKEGLNQLKQSIAAIADETES